MASVRKEILSVARADDVWAAVRDVAALHTRLVPGFVVNTVLEGRVRVVTFANGSVVREPIVTIDEAERRLVWSAQGGKTTHYNASVEVSSGANGGAVIVWRADFLPDSVAPLMEQTMQAGAGIMKTTLDLLAPMGMQD